MAHYFIGDSGRSLRLDKGLVLKLFLGVGIRNIRENKSNIHVFEDISITLKLQY